MLRMIAVSLMIGMTGGQALAGNYCGGYCGSYGGYGSYSYYPKYYEKTVYISTFYPAYVPTPVTSYIPPPIVPLTPLGLLTPVAAGVAPAPIAVAPIIPTAVPARPVVPVKPVVPVTPVVSGGVDVVLQKIMSRLDAIEAKMSGSIPPPPKLGKEKEAVPPPAELDGVGALNLRCASCHSAEMANQPVKKGLAKTKGGGFVLFKPKVEGVASLAPVSLSGNQIADIYDRILLPKENKDHMPPSEELKPDEGNAILQWLGALRKSAKKDQQKDGGK